MSLIPSASAESDSTPPPSLSPSIQSTSTQTLLRSYLVYTLCSLPPIIDNAPSILHAFTHTPIPGLKMVTESIVRHTFFAQFVPGESVRECRTTMVELRKREVGSVLNYSAEAEVEEGDEGEQRKVEGERLREVERALDEAGEFERDVERMGGKRGSTAFALKVTGLIDPAILTRASNTLLRLRPFTESTAPSSPRAGASPPIPYPGAPLSSDRRVMTGEGDLSSLVTLKGRVEGMGVLEGDEGLRQGDMEALEQLWGQLKTLGERTRKNGVKLMVDAEHTCYQPVLDAYTLLLSEEFNRPPKRSRGSSAGDATWNGPLIYGTYQAYLTRQPQYLVSAIRHAEQNDYALGIKLVRGAYYVQERKKWADEKRVGPDPIWPDKPGTDKSYNTSIKTILSTLSSQLASPKPELALSVVFGTHNHESVGIVINTLEKQGLATTSVADKGKLQMRGDVQGKVSIAQLYGMKDDLMDLVVQTFEPTGTPVSLKYIAYGKLAEVMPFLGRRAIENKSLMSGDAGAAAERTRITGELWRRLFG